MRLKESVYIGSLLADLDFDTCLNIGAGDVENLKLSKPWIHQNIFAPIMDRSARTIHLDLVSFNGVVKADVTTTQCQEMLGHIKNRKLILACNILEHVPKNALDKVINSLQQICQKGDYLIASVPYQYPYHADPIDNGFRPTPTELATKFNELKLLESTTLSDGTFGKDLSQMSKLKMVRKILKPLWPFQNIKRYRENLSRLRFIKTPYQTSVVLLTRSP